MTWAGRFFAVALIVGMSGASGCAFLPSDPEECFFDDDCSGDDVCIDFVCRGRVTVLPCGVDVVPAGWRCDSDTLLCNAPLADQRCDVSGVLADGDVCDDDVVFCRTTCGGDEVSPRCLEDEPGVGRRLVCPDGSVDASTCACASKCDCAPGEVCGATGCGAPPARCSSSADCPRGPVTPTDQCEAFLCNGFNDQCFDPNAPPPGSFGDACVVDGDCEAPLLCGVNTGTCAEPCAVAEDCVACSALNGSCTCNVLGFCSP